MNLRRPLVRSALAAASLCALSVLSAAPALAADPISILFVGNSYTFGRVDPVMSYNASNVHDLTAGFYATNQSGANPWEPHPWGGVPGIFKQMTDESGLNYDVSISARNAASLRGQFLNTANSDWDLRGNIASKKWDAVVIQEQSDQALPAGRGKNANLAQFNAYADQIEKYIHQGTGGTFTESQFYPTPAACIAAGGTNNSCNVLQRVIPTNTNANPDAKVYLTDTWARPDMVYAHLTTTADTKSPTGSPIPDGTNTQATLYYNSLQAMTTDLHNSFAAKAASNPNFAGVISVGDAFQLAFNMGVVKTGGFYKPDGTFQPNQAGDKMNLWWDDYLHASKYGSYLDALVQFGTITGRDPLSLGSTEKAAADLGISLADALTLQTVASIQLGFTAAVPEPETWALMFAGLGVLGAVARRRKAA